MSYNTDLQENNAALEEILETVNNLPDSGGNVVWDCIITSEERPPLSWTSDSVSFSVVSGSLKAVWDKVNSGEKPNVLYQFIREYEGDYFNTFAEASCVEHFGFGEEEGTAADIPRQLYIGFESFEEKWVLRSESQSDIENNIISSYDIRKIGGNDSGGNVAYDEAQNLTDAQKAQARDNIGAQPKGNYLTEVPDGYAQKEDIPTDEEIIQLIEEHAPEPSGGGIAVTGAKVGQTVKISAVDENGVPTAWLPADFPSGAEWRLIADITLEEEVTRVDISTDMDGNPFALGAYYLIAKTVPAVNTEDRFTYVKIKINGGSTMNNLHYNTANKNNIYLSDLCIFAGNANPIHFVGVYDLHYNWGYNVMSMSPYSTNYKTNSINLISICPNDYSKVFGGVGTEIKLYGIDI